MPSGYAKPTMHRIYHLDGDGERIPVNPILDVFSAVVVVLLDYEVPILREGVMGI